MPQQNGAGRNGDRKPTSTPDSGLGTPDGDYGTAFPNSRKVFVEGRNGVRVPMREITLAGGEPSLRVTDTSGPLGVDPHLGLDKLRSAWIEGRGGVIEGETTYRPIDPAKTVEIPPELQNRPLRSTGGIVTQSARDDARSKIAVDVWNWLKAAVAGACRSPAKLTRTTRPDR